MSLSDTTSQTGYYTVARTVIRVLDAWDPAAGKSVKIEPGSLLGGYRILRNPSSGDGEVYLMEFEAAGARYRCPLAQFQPRTQAVDSFGVEEQPARNPAAV